MQRNLKKRTEEYCIRKMNKRNKNRDLQNMLSKQRNINEKIFYCFLIHFGTIFLNLKGGGSGLAFELLEL